MTNLHCYSDNNDDELKKSTDFSAVQLIHNKEYQEVRAILNNNREQLSIVMVDGEIFTKGRLLTLDEMSEILNMGFAIQVDDE